MPARTSGPASACKDHRYPDRGKDQCVHPVTRRFVQRSFAGPAEVQLAKPHQPEPWSGAYYKKNDRTRSARGLDLTHGERSGAERNDGADPEEPPLLRGLSHHMSRSAL
jgi:hypothetical protein